MQSQYSIQLILWMEVLVSKCLIELYRIVLYDAYIVIFLVHFNAFCTSFSTCFTIRYQ